MTNHKFDHSYCRRPASCQVIACTERLQLAVLGKPHDKVHKAIDYPYKFLGPKHRILFHDPITAVIVARTASKEKGAGLAAVLHIATDWLFLFAGVQNS